MLVHYCVWGASSLAARAGAPGAGRGLPRQRLCRRLARQVAAGGVRPNRRTFRSPYRAHIEVEAQYLQMQNTGTPETHR